MFNIICSVEISNTADAEQIQLHYALTTLKTLQIRFNPNVIALPKQLGISKRKADLLKPKKKKKKDPDIKITTA